MAKESEGSRYLRSTISNIAFLAAIGYFVHEKALSETSLVTIMTLFIGGYFGVRAYAHKAETEIAANVSNPRMPAQRPPFYPPPGEGGGGGDVHTNVTREIEQQGFKPPIVRTDDVPPAGGRGGRFPHMKRWILEHALTVVPVSMALAGLALYLLIYIAMKKINIVAGIG